MVTDNKPMPNIKDFYILGRPIQTDIGILYPVKVKDYPELLEHMKILTLTKANIIMWLQKVLSDLSQLDDRERVLLLLKHVKKTSLFDLILTFAGNQSSELGMVFSEVYIGYKDLFQFCFKEDVFGKVKTNDEFEHYIELIHTFNGMKYEKPSPNPRIEERNRIKYILQKKKGETVDFESIATSVCVATGMNVSEMTLYQFYRTFDRVGQFKHFDTTSLYCIFSEDVKVEAWFKTIEDKDEKSFITEQQLKRAREQNGLHEKM